MKAIKKNLKKTKTLASKASKGIGKSKSMGPKPINKSESRLSAKKAAKAPLKKLAPPPKAVHAKSTKAPPVVVIKNAKVDGKQDLKKLAKGVEKPAPKTVVSPPQKPGLKMATKASDKNKPISNEPPLLRKPPKKEKVVKGAAGSGPGTKVTIDGRTYYVRTDSKGQIMCREMGCETIANVSEYCRLHYIKNWKKIKRRELILKEKKLNRYVEELVSKYPDKYIEVIRQDLSTDRDFAKVITDLDLDESMDDMDSDMESIDSLIDSIRRDIDDDGDVY